MVGAVRPVTVRSEVCYCSSELLRGSCASAATHVTVRWLGADREAQKGLSLSVRFQHLHSQAQLDPQELEQLLQRLQLQ